MAKRILIMGAAGRDFHVFNMRYRNNSEFEVAAFTAAQIPDIAGRRYPASLAGDGYPDGIPIKDEADLAQIIKDEHIDEVIFAYSDVSYDYIDKRRNIAEEAGARFSLFDAETTMLRSTKPVIAVCAVRTGAGKSPTSRKIVETLATEGRRIVAIRHPMPYGDLEKQAVQRFASLDDLEKNECTIEEMEEYEPYITRGLVVYAGVDYEKILRLAEKEADIILWDGGNNDTPFIKPDLHFVIADPLRAEDEVRYFPGKVNLEMADAIIINKADMATEEQIETVKRNISEYNKKARVIMARMPLAASDENLIRGKKVVVIEDGPTLTHGNMAIGAGTVAAERFGAADIIDPHPYAVNGIKETFEKYPHIKNLIPAMGYSEDQIEDLEESINAVPAECAIIATPIDLTRLIRINKPCARVSYSIEEIGGDQILQMVEDVCRK